MFVTNYIRNFIVFNIVLSAISVSLYLNFLLYKTIVKVRFYGFFQVIQNYRWLRFNPFCTLKSCPFQLQWGLLKWIKITENYIGRLCWMIQHKDDMLFPEHFTGEVEWVGAVLSSIIQASSWWMLHAKSDKHFLCRSLSTQQQHG